MMEAQGRENEIRRRLLMESTELFWSRVGVYNETMWPIAAAMIVAAAFLIHRVCTGWSNWSGTGKRQKLGLTGSPGYGRK
jgi:hypothetical protein